MVSCVLRLAQANNWLSIITEVQQQCLKKDKLIKEKDESLKKLMQKTKQFATKMQTDLKNEKKINAQLRAKVEAQGGAAPAQEDMEQALAQKDKQIAEKDAALSKLKEGVKVYTTKTTSTMQKEKSRRKQSEQESKRLKQELALLQKKCSELEKGAAALDSPRNSDLGRMSSPQAQPAGADGAGAGEPGSDSVQAILDEAMKLATLDLTNPSVVAENFGGRDGSSGSIGGSVAAQDAEPTAGAAPPVAPDTTNSDGGD